MLKNLQTWCGRQIVAYRTLMVRRGLCRPARGKLRKSASPHRIVGTVYAAIVRRIVKTSTWSLGCRKLDYHRTLSLSDVGAQLDGVVRLFTSSIGHVCDVMADLRYSIKMPSLRLE